MFLSNVAALAAAALIFTAVVAQNAPEVWLSPNDPTHGG